jgi:hypothetical protein
MASVITGITLELLLRYPRPAVEARETEEL